MTVCCGMRAVWAADRFFLCSVFFSPYRREKIRYNAALRSGPTPFCFCAVPFHGCGVRKRKIFCWGSFSSLDVDGRSFFFSVSFRKFLSKHRNTCRFLLHIYHTINYVDFKSILKKNTCYHKTFFYVELPFGFFMVGSQC